ncbi:TIGR01906 family membrane protein [Ligilactobacillus ceti]|uniref:TIGR01906 family membrane protein n=1 Tax=Ligilactobacillus ceti TaxID=395085 RepID=UPI0003FD27A4|nr:TIGR01906 family membrane protein [Ligilactobacillus ceti]
MEHLKLDNKWRFWIFVRSFLLWLLIVVASLAFVINLRVLYYYVMMHDNLAQNINLTPDVLKHEYQMLISYLNYPWITELNLKIPMSVQGKHHFAVVKKMFFICYSLLVILIPINYYNWRSLRRKKQFVLLIRPFSCYFQLVLLGAVFWLFFFNQVFIDLHKIVFTDKSWIFSPITDPIILVLPAKFFFLAGCCWLVLVEGITFGLLKFFKVQ